MNNKKKANKVTNSSLLETARCFAAAAKKSNAKNGFMMLKEKKSL